MIRSATTVVCAALSFGWVASALGGDPFFIQLPFLPGSYETAQAGALSFDGRYIAGWDATPVNSRGELVRWSSPGPGGTIAEGMGVPGWGDLGMHPTGISDDGAVICGTGADGNVRQMATRWADPDSGGPGFSALGVLPGPYEVDMSWAMAVSGDGSVIVGSSFSIDFDNGLSVLQPFRWELTDSNTGEGEIVAMALFGGHDQGAANDVSSDGRVIVGQSRSVTELLAVSWIDGQITPLGTLEFGGTSHASAISPDGSIIVGLASLDGSNVAYRWTASGGMQALESAPNGPTGNVTGVANDGSVIGWALNSTGVIWTPDGEGHELSQWLLTEYGLDTSDWLLEYPTDISGDGRTVVGVGDLGVPATAPWLAYLGAACPADITGDGVVNTQDFIAFLNAWAGGDPVADWNEDGTINTQDFIAYLNDWAAGC